MDLQQLENQDQLNYKRIAQAIEYISTNFKKQPSLEEIAAVVNLSPFHFQRLFSEWAGTTPKKFLQYTSIAYAKKLLSEHKVSLFDTAYETGLSGTSRLHDMFVTIEGMTPAEYKNGGQNLLISFSLSASPFGDMLIASTPKGVCYMAFYDEESEALETLKVKFPNATLIPQTNELQQNALAIFQNDWNQLSQIKLHLKGTDFQLKVWEALLTIPMGKLATYGTIAQKVELPKASRAVGTAIGSNPVAFLIPCHRVIQGTGIYGGYRWNKTRKTAIIGWELSRTFTPDKTI
ncbi:bifunctional helix-turn-helix domain-containing protein/methylated-DNA--[protein]-cysteine S-methyltransferase [Mucilaginibacter lacusdianchii]|uniref:bifunctional helix-turn-helix domain-containing protein/methylated-DNA--[protein]-cysteine S-methyltransferase n=1 Tax=Mucilaginibacter lacusdianchii TaxID=2684211 RepID=UPI0018EF0C9F|nr:methylated-DNA--[protein]-cysteine S-methyltransferase [Mucilaginibacter sp. JXJ CY 39]